MFGRERSNNSFLKLEEENPKSPIPPDQTQTEKVIKCATSWNIHENELMDMRMKNYVELALELTMPSSNMKIPWCFKIYPKGYSGPEETDGDADVEFTLKVDTARCSPDTFKAAVREETRMEVKLQFRRQDSDYSTMKESKAVIQVLEFLNIGLRGRLTTFSEMLKYIKNGFLTLDAIFVLMEIEETSSTKTYPVNSSFCC